MVAAIFYATNTTDAKLYEFFLQKKDYLSFQKKDGYQHDNEK